MMTGNEDVWIVFGVFVLMLMVSFILNLPMLFCEDDSKLGVNKLKSNIKKEEN